MAQSGRAGAAKPVERKPREDRWQEIVAVATQIFYEKGYQGASLQDLADRVGILKGSVYYYIASKQDLLVAVIEEVHRAGIENIEKLAATEGNALTRLQRVVIGHIEHVARNLISTTVFLHELNSLSDENRARILGDAHSYQQVFRNLIVEGKREGVVREEIDAKIGALSILGSLNWIYRWYRDGGEFPARTIGLQFADLHVHSLATAKGLAELEPPDPAPKPARRRRTPAAAKA
ncbi:TetR/AcrR family transcriptional regulator [Nakamurella alba]|nr:TetR/AcrR family transcriptional regulator [Nakamurella alba]